MPFARTEDGLAIAYSDVGTGPRNLILLHGWGGAGEDFTETVQRLDRTAVRAIAVDLRGHGDSDTADVDFGIEQVARDVFAVADDAAVASFVAVGYSMGAKVAQYLPLVEADRVEGLVLAASPPASELPAPDFVLSWLDLAGDGEAFVEQAVVPYLHRRVPEHVMARYAANWEKISRRDLERTLHLVASSFADRIGAVRVPVLIVTGARDPLHSPQADQLLAAFPEAQTLELDCGADIPAESPDELAAVIQAFAASLPAGR